MKDRAALYPRIVKTMLDVEALRSTDPALNAVGRIKARPVGRHRWPVAASPSVKIPLPD